jgi:tRNA A-37 threonylcarbamoyl transferase component Bud32
MANDDSRPSLSYRVSGDDAEWEAPDSDEEVAALLRSMSAAPPIAPRALLAWRAPETLVGTTLAHFRVERLVGSGGLGVVYRARDTKLDRAVALKILAPPTRGDTTTRERVLHEARAAARVNDPAVASIYEVGDSDGVAFIAMEYVEGETLQDLLERGPLPIERVVRFGTELARGLSKAHAHGVVHRDLKPENILLDAEGRVKILDFGIAAERGAAPGLAGTPVYMAPEQGRGAIADPRVDVYASGIVLFECVTGLMRGQTDVTDFSTLAPVSLEARACPTELARIIERCLRPDPMERFEDGAALARAFDELVRADDASRRWWKILAAGAVALAAGIGGLGIGALRRHRPAEIEPVPSAGVAADRVRLRRVTANVPERPILGSALSPDGQVLAYADATGLHVAQIGTSDARAIAFAAGEAPQLVRWFEDGRRLAVTVAIDGRDERDLRVVDVASGAQTTLGQGAWSALDVSSDPARVAYAEDDAVGWLDPLEPEVRHEVARKGPGCFIGDVAWSPSRARIAYASLCFASLADTSLETVGIGGGAPVLVAREPRLFNDMVRAGVAWRRGGDVVFSLAEWLPSEPGSNLWSVPVDERTGEPRGARRELTRWVGVGGASFSSDAAGHRIAFVRYDVQTDVYVAPLTPDRALADRPKRLTLKERNERAPAWAPDGSGFYYSTDENGNFDVFFQDLAGSAARPVVASREWESSPIVSPSGIHLLYWRMPPVEAGGATSATLTLHSLLAPAEDRPLGPKIASHPAGVGRPPPWEARVRCASAAGTCFVSEAVKDDLVLSRLDLAGGAPKVVFRWHHADAATNFWDISPDGAWVAVPVANGPVRLAPIDPTKASRDLAMPMGCDPVVVAWSKDQRGVFVTAECAEEPTFRLYDLPLAGPARLVWQDAPNYLLEAEPSPDGKHIAIVVKRPDDDVWLADDL